MTVRNILAHKGHHVTTIDPDRSLLDAAALLAEKRIGAVVVTGAGRTVQGILSERDIVQTLAARGASAFDVPVSQVMTARVETCEPDESVDAIMGRMTTGKFRHVPVIEHGRLAGIVSIGDVVKYRIDEVERESRALREYILTA